MGRHVQPFINILLGFYAKDNAEMALVHQVNLSNETIVMYGVLSIFSFCSHYILWQGLDFVARCSSRSRQGSENRTFTIRLFLPCISQCLSEFDFFSDYIGII